MAYDERCYDLAVEFLEESNPPDAVYEGLAQAIQNAIENYLEDLDNELEAARDAAIERKIDEQRLSRLHSGRIIK